MSNLKLFKPAKQGQDDNAGGPMTRVEFQPNLEGELFTKVTDLDRARGEVQLEEFFAAADTTGAEELEDAHVIVREAPADPKVSVLLFRVPDTEWAYRSDAAAHVEGYTVPGLEIDWRLWGDHPQDVRTLRLWGTPISVAPAVGDVIFVSDESIGGTWRQAFRIDDLSVTRYDPDDLFSFGFQDLVLELSDALEQAVEGNTNPSSYLTDNNDKVRAGQVAPNANYYGITDLTSDALVGDTSLDVGSIYGQLVPAGESETAILDAPALPLKERRVTSGAALPRPLAYYAYLNEATYHAGAAAEPGSVSIAVDATNAGVSGSTEAITGHDDGNGAIIWDVDHSAAPGGWTGTVAYNPLTITLTSSGNNRTRSIAPTFTPAFTETAGPAHSNSQAIDASNRGQTYVVALTPLPAPGAFTFDWRTLARWYRITDNGDGTLGGDGAGTINYLTGTAHVSLPFPPDLDTSTVWSWASADQWARADGDTLPGALIQADLASGSNAATLALSWQAGGVAKAATCGADGVLTGDATGTYSAASGRLRLFPTLLPDGNIDWSVTDGATTYSADESASAAIAGGRVTWTSASAVPIQPGAASVTIRLNVRWANGDPVGANYYGFDFTDSRHDFVDQGDGTLACATLRDGTTGQPATATVDYATGAYDFPETYPNMRRLNRWSGSAWVPNWLYATYEAGNLIQVYQSRADGAGSASGTLTVYTLTAEIADVRPQFVESGSVVYQLGDSIYVPESGATLARDIDPATGSAAAASAAIVSVQQGLITISDWVGGGSNTAACLAAVVRGEEWALTTMHFRSLGAPLRAGSLTLQGRAAADDSLKTGTTDANGDWSGDLTGTTDQEAGVAIVTWSQDMDPASITHSGVIVITLPQDADLIGLDGTRLPSDGKVPIVEPGYQIVIHDEATETLPGGLVAGQVLTLASDKLSYVQLLDANDLVVDTAQYSYTKAQLDAGLVQMADPLDLTGYTQPLKARRLWDDTLPVSGAQATGVINLATPLQRAYASATARVSSLMELGNLQARQTLIFDQQTWDETTWSDTVEGNPAAATFDAANFPPVVVNDGAISERWALRVLVADTTLEVHGETVGNLGQFSMAGDIAPTNPETAKPYFTIPVGGWGSGWDPGNILRVNTLAAAEHGWALRCVNLGADDAANDQVVIQPRAADV